MRSLWLEDEAYDYRISTDLFAEQPAPETGYERIAVEAYGAALRLIEGCEHHHFARSELRGFLVQEAPWEQLWRLSDAEVCERVARLVEARPVVVWRKAKPRYGGAEWNGRGPEALVEEVQARQEAPAAAPARAAAQQGTDQVSEEVDCGEAWAAVGAETEAILARGGDADPIERNRHISAAYAEYYQRLQARTPPLENQWAGIAALVSRQGGCSMIYTDKMIQQGEVLDEAGDAVPGSTRAAVETMGLGYQEIGALVKKTLADTNKIIFDDIYPVMRMHEEHGLAGIDECGDVRPGLKGPVPDDVEDALELLEAGQEREAGITLATYEQDKIVQSQIFDDWQTRWAYGANQSLAGTEIGRELGARPPELALTTECPPYSKDANVVSFEGRFVNVEDRVRYYKKLIDAFEAMSPEEKGDKISTIIGMRSK